MKRYLFPLGIVLFLLPITARWLWFYRGIYQPAGPPATPSYTEIELLSLPMSDEVRDEETESATGNPVVLIDQAHQNNFRLTEIEALTQQLLILGGQVEIVSSSDFSGKALEERLKYASGLIVVTPTDNFSGTEMSAIERFVDAGGRLLTIADPTRASFGSDLFGFGIESPNYDVQILNSLLAPFDLRYSDAYLYSFTDNEGNFRNVTYNQFASSPLTKGVKQLAFYAARPVSTFEGAYLVPSNRATFSSLTDLPGQFSPAVLSPNGAVLALGDMTFMTPPYDKVMDNSTFIARIAEFLTTGERLPNMADFPYIFDQPVTILWSDEFTADADSIALAGDLQQTLANIGLSLHLAQEPSDSSDVLVFGTFDPDDTVRQFLEGVKITYPSESDDFTLGLPDIGSLEPSGLGVMILNQLEQRRALILLADDTENLRSLAELLSGGSLFGCYVTETMALCKVGETDSSSFESNSGFDTSLDEFNDFLEGEG
jgi:hypothetical protein